MHRQHFEDDFEKVETLVVAAVHADLIVTLLRHFIPELFVETVFSFVRFVKDEGPLRIKCFTLAGGVCESQVETFAFHYEYSIGSHVKYFPLRPIV